MFVCPYEIFLRPYKKGVDQTKILLELMKWLFHVNEFLFNQKNIHPYENYVNPVKIFVSSNKTLLYPMNVLSNPIKIC